jgi:hypothetical protein
MVASMPVDPGAASAGTWSVADQPPADRTQSCCVSPARRAVQAVITTVASTEEKETCTESPGRTEFALGVMTNSGSCCNPPYLDAAVTPATAPVGITGSTTTAKITVKIVDRRIRRPEPRTFPGMGYRLTRQPEL